MRKPIGSILLNSFGQVAVLDKQGEQIPELQVSFVELWAEHAVNQGYDPIGLVIECTGRNAKIQIFKAETGFNWERVCEG